MDGQHLARKLAAEADESDGEVAELLTAASEQIVDQAERLTELQAELEETNEGMVALTLELQEAEQRYRSLFENAVEGVYKTTPDGSRYVLANNSMAEILGYESPEALQRAVTDIRTDVFVDGDRYDTYVQSLTEDGTVENFEYRVRRRDGEVRWVSDNARLLNPDSNNRSFRGGIVDITELKRYEQQLEQKNAELEALNRVVRHDICNDMQIIRGYAEHLRDRVDAENQSVLEKIITTSDHVLGLTEDAREFIETITADDDLELEPTAVKSLLTYEIERQREAHPEATIQINGSIPDVDVTANDMLSSVFRNLLGNAIQHNDTEEPTVDVSVIEQEENIEINIADDGPGIPDKKKDTIFGKGEQSLDSDGTGIGLYIVHQLTMNYEGEVWVEDRDGRGSAFVVSLPV